MFYEIRTYTVQPGKLKEYLQNFEAEGLPIISRHAKLIGWWYTEVGTLNQVVHIWAWESLDERVKRRAALLEDPNWMNRFIAKATPLLIDQESRIMLPASFSPIR
ncbi:NIPSNAP family protein [Paraburkholderia steynii]|uniref:NIPSNAP family protein n=1 Tax=Paraburkholderia steynii TaxID=1245441 RepID=A0A4R0XC60_9BURK|nr:NIPSNAP family protein [Paraburkholderia steynii]